jgi:TonB-linked SusC/RagA family outer membrane protein
MKKIISVVFIDKNQLKQTLLTMRLITYLLLIAVFPTFATGYSQSTMLKFTEKPVTLANVIETIETQTDYRIFYNTDQITLETPVKIEKTETTVAEALKTSLEGSKISYKLMGQMIVLAPKEYISEVKKVTGTVTDDKGASIPGVNILLEGTNVGTQSDINGKFTIEVPAEGGVLVFTFIGYTAQKVSVKGGAAINVTMQIEAIGLDEVVVIGYGSRAKKDVTTAISTMDNKQLAKVVTMNPVMAMQGQMSGVQVSANSGNLMDKPTIRIRGVNTWGVSDPLYVVDGIPIQVSGEGADANTGINSYITGKLNIMSMIDPNDIESISVLKDASAAAIYGVRAANGVILITTKKGTGDKPRIEFSSRIGFQNMPQHLNVLNTQQYTKHLQDVYASDTNMVRRYNADLIDPNSPSYLGNSPTYDWQKEMKNKNAPLQEYSVRLLGGTGKTDYFMSVGYASQEGTLKGNNLERYNVAFKINSQINKWLRTGLNYRLSSNNGVNAVEDLDLQYVKLAQAPAWQPVHGDGPNGFASVVKGLQPDGSWNNDPIWGNGTQWNYEGLMSLNGYNYKGLRNMGTAYLEIEPVKDLKLKGSVSIDANNRFMQIFVNNQDAYLNPNFGDPSQNGDGSSAGYLEENTVTDFNLVKELSLNYRKSFNDHNFDFLLNTMEQNVDSKASGVSTMQMATSNPDLRTIFPSVYVSGSTQVQRSALAGTMARLGYNYNSRYYLDATVRRDGSSRFAPDYRWGVFPSVSAAWRMSAESFMKDITWLTDLKLRTGYGQLGNQEVPNLQYLAPINTNPAYGWGSSTDGIGHVIPGATVFGIPTPNLQWEKTTTFNIGLDGIISKNLSFSAEYYNKLTDGIIQTMTVPGSVGATLAPYGNVATVRNKGMEMSLTYNNHAGKLNYSLSANFTTVKNIVEKTYNDIPFYADNGLYIEEGQSMFSIRGYKNAGIFQTKAEVDAWKAKYSDPSYQTALVAPGDYHFQDLRGAPTEPSTFYSNNPDGKVDSYDQVNLGNTIPKFYYGFNINLQYQDFDFSTALTGVGGVYKYNALRASLEYSPSDAANLSTNILNAWTPTNTNTSIPRVMGGDPASNFRYSDLFVEKAGYLRMSNIQLGYTLPQKVYDLVKHAISNFRVYASVSNVFTITPYTGLDPENDNYPTPRIISFGLNVNF